MPTFVTITLETRSDTTVLLQSNGYLKCPTSAISNKLTLVYKTNPCTVFFNIFKFCRSTTVFIQNLQVFYLDSLYVESILHNLGQITRKKTQLRISEIRVSLVKYASRLVGNFLNKKHFCP